MVLDSLDFKKMFTVEGPVSQDQSFELFFTILMDEELAEVTQCLMGGAGNKDGPSDNGNNDDGTKLDDNVDNWDDEAHRQSFESEWFAESKEMKVTKNDLY